MGNVFGRDEDHVRRDQATTADLQQYAEARQQLGQMQVPVLLHAGNPHERLYIAALDGTGNSMRKDKPENWSAVAKIHDQLIHNRNPAIYSGYVEGIGTQDHLIPRAWDGWRATSFDERVETAYYQLCTQSKQWLQEDPQAQIRVAGVGFSRGAEEVAALNRMVEERGILDPDNAVIHRDHYGLVTSAKYNANQPPLAPPKQTLQAVMLFDPVSTNNTEYDRRLAPSTVGAFDIRSDDKRNDFKGDRLFPDGFSENNRFLSVHVPGPHSTAGDSYKYNGLGVLSANMGVAYLNSLSDHDFLKPQAVVQDPAKYQKLHSEDHLPVYSTSYYDQHHERGYTDQLGADNQCKIAQPLSDCFHKAPVDPQLASQVEYRPVRLPEQQAPPPMPDQAQSRATSSGDIFRQMTDAALRGDAAGMRAASSPWLGSDAAQTWLQQGRDANEQQRESQLAAQLAQQQSQQPPTQHAPVMQR
ncbi:phospholipase effector Tle1 domain-containing protein [Solilutibacter silvestris]|uniref:T6SS Phospholipase effector Tle1-like catalytic domain-containing protein n=1 Tax=Solilutibacter silvestris TaxID=1645665 RepID=A0A2K1Q172_9GAMM|nr:DUF2235 domain-containing protein [Lysobacter silvestris]PNS08781.1 hypothetical protein Lysil_0410 [Lysobacter silvestris]